MPPNDTRFFLAGVSTVLTAPRKRPLSSLRAIASRFHCNRVSPDGYSRRPIPAGRHAAGLFCVYTINSMNYEFDQTKDESNIDKQGLSLTDADDFEWETAVVREDTRKANPREVKRYVSEN